LADASPALVLHFGGATTAPERDRLVALLDEYHLIAIQEDDVAAPSRWTVHFADVKSRDEAAAIIGNTPEYRDLRLERVEIEDDDWARRTQADLPAVRIGSVIVAPPWDLPTEEPKKPDVLVIIEPSRGFGTGHHQSTRLCLALLQTRALTNRTVIDVGTGSGVLAIAAARLGAGYVAAIDVDPDAIGNARENAARNGVQDVVEAHVGELSSATLPPADIVTANLTASLLERHAHELRRLVKPAGILIAAGFTVDERDRVINAFQPGMSAVESAEEDGWWGLIFA
jgi:ribosomal protein L11 methyltransferase